MLHGFASLFAGMSLAEELHTICFTVFPDVDPRQF
jgi:hypothetical protein